jgi:hypothetical protein
LDTSYEYTTTLAFVSLLVQTIIQSNHSSTHPGGPISPRRNYFRVTLYPFIQPKLRDVTASQPKPTERTSHYHTWYIRVHDNTRQHDTHYQYQYRLVTHSIPLSLQSCSVILTSGCFRSTLNRSFPGARGPVYYSFRAISISPVLHISLHCTALHCTALHSTPLH